MRNKKATRIDNVLTIETNVNQVVVRGKKRLEWNLCINDFIL